MTNRLPLEGLTVLDVSSFIAAPAAAVVLGDYGADVIKVEQPGEGDPHRANINLTNFPNAQVNYPWHLDARNKRSIALDLKSPRGRAALDRLVARADVLITNFPFPVRTRLKLNYDDVKHLNDRLIYASFSGYGEQGADRDQIGFDSNAFFARSGILDSARYEDQPPAFSLPGSGDRPSAMSLLSAILLALMHRQHTGRGTWVASSLLANGLWANGVHARRRWSEASCRRGLPAAGRAAASPICTKHAMDAGCSYRSCGRTKCGAPCAAPSNGPSSSTIRASRRPRSAAATPRF